MENEILEFEGKKYVSSGRAGMLVGYTKDYVGQLARAGKLEAKVIGRNWYVSEDSIRKHKLGVHYKLTKPKKSHGKTGDVKDEISNINIDIYDNNKKNTENAVSIHTYNKNRSAIASTETAKKESICTDHSYGARALLDADIRYEQGEALSFEDGYYIPLEYRKDPPDTKSAQIENFSEQDTAVLPVRIHTQQSDVVSGGRINRGVYEKRANVVNIDGMMSVPMRKVADQKPFFTQDVPTSRTPLVEKVPNSVRKIDTSRQKEFVLKKINEERVVHKKAYDTVSIAEYMHRQPSKMIPVVTGTVVFVLYALWYMFF